MLTNNRCLRCNGTGEVVITGFGYHDLGGCPDCYGTGNKTSKLQEYLAQQQQYYEGPDDLSPLHGDIPMPGSEIKKESER